MSGNAEPPSADDLAARAVEMIGRQRFDEAEALAREALAAAPRHLTANLARAACARARGALDVAEGCLEVVLADHPASAAGHSSLGMVRLRQERLEEAEGLFAKAVALDPKDAVNAFRWGECLRRLGRLEAAETAFVEALRRQPDQTDTLFQLATVRGEMGRSEEACGLLERLLAVDPENASARFNLGFHYLRLGRLAAGWPLYEARWQHPEAPARRFAETPWDGSEAGARHLLVHAEQGLGDAIQFVRFVPQLAARAERVTLLCQRSLLGLFRRSLALEVLGFEDPLPPAHGHVPLLSLPGLLGTTLEKLPAEVPYLHPRETASLPGQPAIGICWAGQSRVFAQPGPFLPGGAVRRAAARHRCDVLRPEKGCFGRRSGAFCRERTLRRLGGRVAGFRAERHGAGRPRSGDHHRHRGRPPGRRLGPADLAVAAPGSGLALAARG